MANELLLIKTCQTFNSKNLNFNKEMGQRSTGWMLFHIINSRKKKVNLNIIPYVQTDIPSSHNII